jgi:hypothetical protein
MEKIKIPNGLFAYRATAEDTFKIGGFGTCDDCGQFAAKGYLVPVLNHYQCPRCFHEFKSSAKNYPEDLPFQQRTMEYFESKIPLGVEISDWADREHLLELMDSADLYPYVFPGDTDNGQTCLIYIHHDLIVQFISEEKPRVRIYHRDGTIDEPQEVAT